MNNSGLLPWQWRWQSYRRTPDSAVPAALKPWLFDEGSLTQRLIQLSKGDFTVRVLSQHWGRPRPDECQVLDLRTHATALIREVILLGGNEPWVYARSVLPVSTMTGPLRHLRNIGNRPLGQLLFNNPTTRRSAIEVAAIEADVLPLELPTGIILWGRRSVFTMQNSPILVSEVFLPALINKVITY